MTALKKTPPTQNSAYKLAAAARRAKVAAMRAPIIGLSFASFLLCNDVFKLKCCVDRLQRQPEADFCLRA